MYSRFRKGTIKIPKDTTLEFKEHMKNLVKVYKKDADGNPTASYEKVGDDHYAHAMNYAEIALPLAIPGVVEDIQSPI